MACRFSFIDRCTPEGYAIAIYTCAQHLVRYGRRVSLVSHPCFGVASCPPCSYHLCPPDSQANKQNITRGMLLYVKEVRVVKLQHGSSSFNLEIITLTLRSAAAY